MSSTARSKPAPRRCDRRARVDAPERPDGTVPAAILNLRDLYGDTSAAARLRETIVEGSPSSLP